MTKNSIKKFTEMSSLLPLCMTGRGVLCVFFFLIIHWLHTIISSIRVRTRWSWRWHWYRYLYNIRGHHSVRWHWLSRHSWIMYRHVGQRWLWHCHYSGGYLSHVLYCWQWHRSNRHWQRRAIIQITWNQCELLLYYSNPLQQYCAKK